MAEPSTFIKLDRCIINWRWFSDPNTLQVFIYLLISANIVDNPWRDMVIKRGQVVRSVKSISRDTGLTAQQVRTALGHLKSTKEVTSEKAAENTVFTIKNYDKFQRATNKSTNEQQSINKASTNDQQLSKNDKEVKKEKNTAFDVFWSAYPRKVNKTAAQKSFAKLSDEEVAQIMPALEKQKQSQQWQKENGQYIPHPTTWLNQRRWENEETGINEQPKALTKVVIENGVAKEVPV